MGRPHEQVPLQMRLSYPSISSYKGPSSKSGFGSLGWIWSFLNVEPETIISSAHYTVKRHQKWIWDSYSRGWSVLEAT